MDHGHEKKLSALRLANVAACARFLRDRGPATLSEISLGTGLSRPTVRDRVKDLIGIGLAQEVATVPQVATLGRPPMSYAFRPGVGFVVAAELNRHYDRILLSDLTGRVFNRVEHKRDPLIPGPERLAALCESIRALAPRSGPAAGPLLGVGLAVSGVLTASGALRWSTVYPDDVPDFVSQVVARFDVPVHVSGDMNAATRSEQRLGAARGHDNVVFALIWHQVVAGLLLSGRIHAGRQGIAGELAQLRRLEGDEIPAEWADVPLFREVLARAAGGDDDARRSVAEFAARAGNQIASLVLTVDPDVVVLGGPLSDDKDLVAQVIESVHASFAVPVDVEIVTSQLRTDGPLLGVLLDVLDEATRALLGEPLPDPLDLGQLAESVGAPIALRELDRPIPSPQGICS